MRQQVQERARVGNPRQGEAQQGNAVHLPGLCQVAWVGDDSRQSHQICPQRRDGEEARVQGVFTEVHAQIEAGETRGNAQHSETARLRGKNRDSLVNLKFKRTFEI